MKEDATRTLKSYFLTADGTLHRDQAKAVVYTAAIDAEREARSCGLLWRKVGPNAHVLVNAYVGQEENFHGFRPLTRDEHQGFLGIDDVHNARISAGRHSGWEVVIIAEPSGVQVHFFNGDGGESSWGREFRMGGEQEAGFSHALARGIRRWFRAGAPTSDTGWEYLAEHFGLEDLG